MLPSDLRGINVRDFLAQAVARHPEQLFLVARDEEVTYDARLESGRGSARLRCQRG